MSLFVNRSPRDPSFYLEKAQSQIERTRLSYGLAVQGVMSSDASPLLDAAEPFLGGPTGRREAKIREVIVKSHFLLLKVNFELFLQLIALAAWRVALREHREAIRSLSREAESRLRSVVLKGESVLSHSDPIEALAAAIVPRHGLGSIRTVLKEVGLDIVGAFNKVERSIWAQLATAFAVRHLIEHRNGLVDEVFRREVQGTWPGSSLGKTGGPSLSEETRVYVTEGDLMETGSMMTLGLRALQPLVDDLQQRSDHVADRSGVGSR